MNKAATSLAAYVLGYLSGWCQVADKLQLRGQEGLCKVVDKLHTLLVGDVPLHVQVVQVSWHRPVLREVSK